jgi:ATPase family associated with various cellular activities (AAA)
MTYLDKINQVRADLKSEFIGIDDIIDAMISKVQLLFLEPELVTQPIIVCLFGPAAVGKTTLIRRFRDLMDIGHSFAEIDARDLANNTLVNSIEDCLGEERLIDSQGKPLFILLDEFDSIVKQDNSYDSCSDLWSFMSDGRIPNFQGEKIKNIKFFLSQMIQLGISFKHLDEPITTKDKRSQAISQLQRGIHKFIADNKFKISAGPDDFISRNTSETLEIDEMMDNFEEESAENVEIPYQDNQAFDLLKSEYSKMIYAAVKHYCNSGSELSYDDFFCAEAYHISTFIDNNVDKNKLNSEYDLTKSVLFVCGNFYTFDYTVYGSSTLYDADQIRDITASYTVAQLKEKLKENLREKQLNRLGSNFLLLPTFCKASFETLINQRMNWFQQVVRDKHGFELTFHSTIKDYIYNRGVSPLEGFRPLKGEISSFISNAFALIVEAGIYKFDHGLLKFNADKKVIELNTDGFIITSLPDNSFNEDEINQEILLLNSLEVAAQILVYAREFRTMPKQIVVGVNKNQTNIVQIHEAIDSLKVRRAMCKFRLAPFLLGQELFGENAPLIYSSDLRLASQMIQDLVCNHTLIMEERETLIREYNAESKFLNTDVSEYFRDNRKVALDLIQLLYNSKGPITLQDINQFLSDNNIFVLSEDEFQSTDSETMKFSSIVGKTTFSLALSMLQEKK